MAAKEAPQGIVGSALRYKASDKDYRLIEVATAPADNGFVVTCRHEPIRVKNGPDIPYREPSKLVFNDVDALLKAMPGIMRHKTDK